MTCLTSSSGLAIYSFYKKNEEMMKEVLKEEGKGYMYDIIRLLLKSQTSGNSIEREKERGTERGRKESGREGE